jgi:hypothetical protein
MPAASNTNLRVTEVDFDSIKTNLKTFLKSQSEFSDYDFEGSAMNVLLDILAYNTHYMAYQLNMTANELFLETAQLRNSVLSHAKLLGYTPRSRSGAKSYVNVRITPPDGNTVSSLTIPKYTKFISEAVDSVNYNFLTTDSYTTTKNNSSFLFSNVELTEGEVLNYTFVQDQNNPRQRFTIPSSTIDTRTLAVIIQESTSNTNQTAYELSDDLTELNSNSEVYFLDETDVGAYTVYFGDGVFGKKLSNGNIITVSCLDTNGEAANKANAFTLGTPISGFSNTQVTTLFAAAAGAERESIEDIKFRAPLYYTTQNRAITKNDYNLLLKRDYPNIESISIWGGEEYDPPQYGRVFISLRPKTGFFLTESQKQTIINDIIANRSVLTVTPIIIDPDYLFLNFKITVFYNPKRTTRSADEIKSLVRQTVLNFRDANLDGFNSTFRTSKLQTAIDNADKSITSCDVELFVSKQITLINGVTQNYEIDFFSPLHKGGQQEKLISRPSVVIRDSNDALRSVYFEEVQGAFTGIDSVSITSPGSGYSDNPTVTINGDGKNARASATVVNGQITSIKVLERGSDYTVATVTITDTSGLGATAKVNLEGKNGVIRSYYIPSDTSEKVIVNENAGTIDYDTGKIVLQSFTGLSVDPTPYYGLEQGVFALQIRPDKDTLFPIRNRIITIDESDLTAIEIDVVVDDSPTAS